MAEQPTTALVPIDPSKAVAAMRATSDKGNVMTGIAAFGQLMQRRKGAIASVAASFMSPERVMKIALNNFTKNTALLNCTGESVFRAVLQAVELGLEPGGALGQAHLVPYGKDCTLIVDWKGLAELAYRSGRIASINAFCIYEGDTFEHEEGLDPKLRHIPDGQNVGNPLKVTHVASVVLTTDGAKLYDVMTRAEVEAIRKRSRTGNNGPWVTDWCEMAKKTILRRTLKRCPKSVEMQKALALDNAIDTGQHAAIFESDFVEGEVIETTSTRTEEVKEATGMNGTVNPYDQ
jgi:recombination protein RecT